MLGSEANSRATSAEENPFYILDLQASASPKSIEKQKQKLLGMLKLGLASATLYETPVGSFSRTEETVRQAAAALENPSQRIHWELWVEASDRATEELGSALALHYELQKQALLGDYDDTDALGDRLDALGLLWDEVFESDFDSMLKERAAKSPELNATACVDSFAEQVISDLVTLIDAAPAFDLDEFESEVGMEAVDRVCQRSAELLESSAQNFAEQWSTQGATGAWPSWKALKAQYRTKVEGRGEYIRSLSFDAVYDPIGDLAIVMYEDEHYQLAEGLFLWLSDEAADAGADEISEQQAENASSAAEANLQSYGQQVESESSSWWSTWGLAIIVMAVIRMAMKADCGSSNDYDPSLEVPIDIQEILRNTESNNPSEYSPDSDFREPSELPTSSTAK